MNILLTNDDGYNSIGIQLLKEKLKSKHNVYVCAPSIEMSATSHAISLFKPLELIKHDTNSYSLYGTPADCVKVALFYLFKNIKFDLIISGINNGPNMGEDIFYSGTVAGAREGCLNNIFSIAASLDGWSPPRYFDYTVDVMDKIVDTLQNKNISTNIFLNINFPNIPKANKICITHLGERIYYDFVIKEEKNNKIYLTITGDNPGFNPIKGSDLNTVFEGNISITPLAIEVCDLSLLNEIKFLEEISL